MSAAARPIATAADRAMTLESLLVRRTAREIVVLAQELLLLDSDFDRAFPRELSRTHAPSIESATRRILSKDPSVPGLSRQLRRDLLSLTSPPLPHAKLPSLRVSVRIADELLRLALTLNPDSAATHLVTAQKAWVFGIRRDDARHGFEHAYDCAATPASAAVALLHLAILRADEGFIDEAIDLLTLGAQLHPESLPVAWTLAVYALATGRRRLFERQLPAIARTAGASALRRRGLSLGNQMNALARSGVLTVAGARARTEELLSRLPPIHAARNRS